MRKLIFSLTILLLLCSSAFGATYTQKQLVFRDETGKKLSWTTLTSVTIQDAGTATTSTIYSDRAGTAMTNPIVSGLSDPSITFFSRDADYKVTATDGTYTLTADNVTGSDGWLVFPRYLQAMSSRTASDSQTFTFGSNSDWVAGAADSGMDWTPGADNSAYYIGTTTFTSDLFLYGGTANYDCQWDASRNHLTFRDNAAAGFGAGAASGTVDYTIKTAGSTGALIITAVTGDDAVQIGDGSVATDFICQNTITAGADVHWDDSGEEWNFGATNIGVDVKFWADTAAEYAIWDESIDTLSFVGSNIKFDDTSILYLGTKTSAATADGDVTLQFDSANLELFATAIDTPFAIGGTTYGFDMTYYFETSGTIADDFDGNIRTFDGADIVINDNDYIKFGDSLEVTILYDDAGSDDFKIDCTKTVAGNAFIAETTDGGILLNADGGSNGDITLDSADDIILTTAGKLTITNTEAVTVSGAITVAGTATFNGVITGDGATEVVGTKYDVVTDIDDETLTIAESGTVFDNDSDGDGTIFTLPEASTAIGVWYTFVVVAAQSLNINPGAANDRFIDPITNAVGDSIQSSTAGDSVTVLCIGDDSWVITAAYPAATDWPDSG